MKKHNLEDIDLDKFSEKMHSESDRACAILGAALLDAKLENLFNKRLCGFHDELLSSTGPISTFSAKIRIANALAWISDTIQKDLDTIRGIRNEFAHSFDYELSFQNESINDRCKNLCVARHYLDGYDDAINAPNQNLSPHVIAGIKDKFSAPRWRFQITVEFISQYLDDLPTDVFEYDGPDLLKEAHDLSAGFRVQISATSIVDSKK